MEAVTTSHIGVISAIQGYRSNSPTSGTKNPVAYGSNPGEKKQSDDSVSISSEGKELSEKDPIRALKQSASSNQKDIEGDLDTQDLKILNDLKQRDREVRAHEQAHLAAAGGHATGGPSYTLQKGPDGNSYAVGGEVGIDLSKENDPSATIQKMQTVKRAALAPASPSSTDRQVAAQASVKEAQARQELLQEQQEALLVAEEAGASSQGAPQPESAQPAEGVSVSALKASIAIYEQMSAM